MRFRAPANVSLRRAQLTMLVATLVPTVLMTAVGIVLLAVRSGGALAIVSGILVLTFCTTTVAGYTVSAMFLRRGASLARVQQDFLSSISHELRTPLTSIILFVESLRDERLTDEEEKQKCFDLLSGELARLQGLVEKLIRLSQIEAGHHAFERKTVAIADVAEEAVRALKTAALTEEVEVDVDIEPDLAVTGDHQALAQTVCNLLINAWKYTDSHGRKVSLKGRTDGRWVVIEVTDNGRGIPLEEQGQIFDHFERGKSAVDDGSKGSGLGLATVRAIIRAHRGKIEVRSRPGKGSTFRIKLKRPTRL